MTRRAPHLLGPWGDGVLIWGAPLWAVLAGAALRRWPGDDAQGDLFGHPFSWLGVLSLTEAHLVLAFVRGYANAAVFRRFRRRLMLVPAVLILAIPAHPWTMAITAFVVVWWDVYHSAMQGFGLGRMYDAAVGNDVQGLRRLDQGLFLLVYAGPLIVGAGLRLHVADLESFRWVAPTAAAAIAERILAAQPIVAAATVALGAVFAGAYVRALLRARAAGYRAPWPKYALAGSTLVAATVAWGFNRIGEAFFIMNLFHAVQYFAVVFRSEGRHWHRRGTSRALVSALSLTTVVLALAYGLWAEAAPNEVLWFTMLKIVAILHFWMDGFMWSVRTPIEGR